jgi:hypothetical protein
MSCLLWVYSVEELDVEIGFRCRQLFKDPFLSGCLAMFDRVGGADIL